MKNIIIIIAMLMIATQVNSQSTITINNNTPFNIPYELVYMNNPTSPPCGQQSFTGTSPAFSSGNRTSMAVSFLPTAFVKVGFNRWGEVYTDISYGCFTADPIQYPQVYDMTPSGYPGYFATWSSYSDPASPSGFSYIIDIQ